MNQQEQLVELLSNVIHALEMRSYEIEDATLSHQCEVQANEFHNQMISILQNETESES